MNINVRAGTSRFWSLGMVRVFGTMLVLETKLAMFGLSLQHDIVAICTDGASVMKKVGQLVTAKQQLCYAHGISLAVLDVIYKQGRQWCDTERN